MFPPMMHSWWLKEFRTPAHWFDARLRFTRTTAVWSMVGHILGLGDRHGENLLIDRATGDCVHVDFSCLFDKARALCMHVYIHLCLDNGPGGWRTFSVLIGSDPIVYRA